MWQMPAKYLLTALVPLVPKVVEGVYDYFFFDNEEKVKPITRKNPDRTKLSLIQISYIKDSYIAWKNDELSDFSTRQDLADYLNKRLGLNKAVSTYAKIWNS